MASIGGSRAEKAESEVPVFRRNGLARQAFWKRSDDRSSRVLGERDAYEEAFRQAPTLEDIPAQIFVVGNRLETAPHKVLIHAQGLRTAIRKTEKHVLEQRRHHRVKSAGADVLHAVVHVTGDLRDLGDAVGRTLQLRAVRLDKRRILICKRVLGLGHDSHEVRLSERLELHANRKSSL